MSHSGAANESSITAPCILTINGGSSSIKFAVFSPTESFKRLFNGPLPAETRPIEANTFAGAAENLIAYLRERLGIRTIAGIGHRVVHGGVHLLEHQLITQALVDELRRTQPLDLAHLPREIALIEAFRGAFPKVPQVACFDTAFHRDLPTVAQILPIPRHYFTEGIRRFGFHGLSFTYLMKELERVAGPDAARGRVILAHLGSGASLAAVRGGKPIDTTMAFTPTAGLVMGTRPGDLDPGLLVYLMRAQGMSPEQMDDFISNKCGLLGVSEISSDMRDLLNKGASDSHGCSRGPRYARFFGGHRRALPAGAGGDLRGIGAHRYSSRRRAKHDQSGSHLRRAKSGICAGDPDG